MMTSHCLVNKGLGVMTDELNETSADVIVIVMDDVLIAEDLALTIAEAAPTAQIVKVSMLAQVQAAIADSGRVRLAFINANPSMLRGSSLAQMFSAHGTRVVLTGLWDDAQAAVHGCEALPFPFATEDVYAVIARKTVAQA